MTVRVTVDESKCVAAGQCVRVAPQVFDQRDSDGVVVLLESEVDDLMGPSVREAAVVCPSAVIHIED